MNTDTKQRVKHILESDPSVEELDLEGEDVTFQTKSDLSDHTYSQLESLGLKVMFNDDPDYEGEGMVYEQAV